MFQIYYNFRRIRRLSVHFTRKLSSLPNHTLIKFPELPDKSPLGKIDKWMVAVGQKISAGDEIVSIETSQFVIALSAESSGYLAKKMYEDGSDDIPVNTAIGIMVDEVSSLTAFASKTAKPESSKSTHQTTLSMLRMIKKLMASGKVSDVEFCNKLLSLSRKEDLNDELTAVFESSFSSGDMTNDENFDADFFLMNAKDIVSNYNVKK